MVDTASAQVLSCPSCTGPGLVAEQAIFECQYCGIVLVAERTTCPACGVRNTKGADSCVNCGEPLSIVASILNRQGAKGPPLWIRRLRSQVEALQVSEAKASSKRFESLLQIDRRRLRAEAEDRLRQREKDRQILFYGAVGVLVLVLSVMLILVIATPGR